MTKIVVDMKVQVHISSESERPMEYNQDQIP